jgi:hypothetical protein
MRYLITEQKSRLKCTFLPFIATLLAVVAIDPTATAETNLPFAEIVAQRQAHDTAAMADFRTGMHAIQVYLITH